VQRIDDRLEVQAGAPTRNARLQRDSMSAIASRAAPWKRGHRPVFRRIGDVDEVVRHG